MMFAYCVALAASLLALFLRTVLLIYRAIPRTPPGSRFPLPTLTWDEAERVMGSGDILLVRNEGLTGRTVTVCALSWYTHVALVVRSPSDALLGLFGANNAQQPTSTSLLWVVECDVPRPMLLTMEDWRRKYADAGHCVWRKLLYGGRTVGVHGLPPGTMEPILGRLRLRPYPTLLQVVLRRGLPGWLDGWLTPPAQQCPNCVEMACGVLHVAGALPRDINTRLWTPDSFSRWEDPCLGRPCTLVLGGPQDEQEGQLCVEQGGDNRPLPGAREGAAEHSLGVQPPGQCNERDGQAAHQIQEEASSPPPHPGKGEQEQRERGL